MKLNISPARSFDYWSVWEFIKGRKKTAITISTTILAYFVAGDFPSAIIAASIVESTFAIVEYYFKKVDVN